MIQCIATDTELTSIANAIRNITQSNEKLAFPNGFTGAIEGIGEQIINTPVPEEPDIYAKYTRDSGNHITGIKLHGFKEIPADWFSQNNYLLTVDCSECPELTSVNDKAFYYCNNVETVILPDSVTYIGDTAFIQANITWTQLPNNLQTIGEKAFSACSYLALTSLPNSLTSIGASAFYNCQYLNLTTVPNGITELKNQTFYWTGKEGHGLKTFTIPATVTILGDRVFFESKNLETVIFKGTPQSMGQSIFYGCIGLKDIYVPWTEETFSDICTEWQTQNPDVTIHYNYTE